MSSAGVAVSRIRVEEPLNSPRYLHNAFDLNSAESILVWVNLSSGIVIPLPVLKSDSIECVKLRIQKDKGYYVKSQKLICGGKELSRSNSLVRDYGVADGDVFHLRVKVSDVQNVVVRTYDGKELAFNVGRYRDVKYLKKKLAKKGKGFVEGEEEDQELLSEGKPLNDWELVADICKHDDAVIHLLVKKKSSKVSNKRVDKSFDEVWVEAKRQECDSVAKKDFVSEPDFVLKPFVVKSGAETPPEILDVIRESYEGLESGNRPIMSAEGSGGVYFMQDSTGLEYVSVFKPTDEEPNARNNPHGLTSTSDGEGLKRGTIVGEGAYREVAAYLLDHPLHGKREMTGEAMGFAGVPPTGIVWCKHKDFNHPNHLIVKVGSLQKFMKNNGSCEDIGPGSFPVEEVHKISVLDIRLANADRHSGNILFKKDAETGRIILIPIDHGYCLPESFEDCTFEWLNWPQAKQPYAADTVEYIRSLDAEKDLALLQHYGWELPIESARTLRISTMLLRKGVERGLTPYEIGSIMCRVNMNEESVVEQIVQEALESVLPGTSEGAFLESVSHIMDRRLDEIYV